MIANKGLSQEDFVLQHRIEDLLADVADYQVVMDAGDFTVPPDELGLNPGFDGSVRVTIIFRRGAQ